MSSTVPGNSRMRTKPSGALHVGSISPQDHGGTLASRRSARKEIRRSITRGRERERSLAARAGLNGRLWIPGISGLRRCRASGRDGPVTRAQLVCHRSGDHAGKEQSTECKLATQPYDAWWHPSARRLHTGCLYDASSARPARRQRVRVALESAFRRSGNRFAAESASSARNLERFLIPTNLVRWI